MSEPATSFLETVKDKLPKATGTLLSAAFLLCSVAVQYGGKNQHIVDVQAQQDKRIGDVETAIKKDLATRDALADFKDSTDKRLSDIKDQLKAYHDDEVRFHHR